MKIRKFILLFVLMELLASCSVLGRVREHKISNSINSNGDAKEIVTEDSLIYIDETVYIDRSSFAKEDFIGPLFFPIFPFAIFQDGSQDNIIILMLLKIPLKKLPDNCNKYGCTNIYGGDGDISSKNEKNLQKRYKVKIINPDTKKELTTKLHCDYGITEVKNSFFSRCYVYSSPYKDKNTKYYILKIYKDDKLIFWAHIDRELSTYKWDYSIHFIFA